MATKDKCIKGISCGLSCISSNKECISEFPKEVQLLIEKLSTKLGGFVKEESVEDFKDKEFVEKLSKLPDGKKEMMAELSLLIMGEERDKSDKFAFSEDEIKGMQSRAKELDSAYEVSVRSKDKPTQESLREPGGISDYVNKYRNREVSDEDVEVLWDMLPKKVKRSLTVAGSLKKGNFWKPGDPEDPLNEDKKPDPNGGDQSSERAKMLLKVYMRQGGKDIYTGQPLPLMQADLEHIIPFEVGGQVSEDPANWGWTRTGINAGRGKRDITEYIEGNVTKKLGLKSIEDNPDSASEKALRKINSDYNKTQKINKIKKESKKELEGAEWIRKPYSEWTEEQKLIFDRLNKGLNDPVMKKGYYIIENMLPGFSSTASIHPIKRSSRRKVWSQELGTNLTEESLNLWKEAGEEGKKRIEDFWVNTGPKITETIKKEGLYSEDSSKEAMDLARKIVSEEYKKLKDSL